MHETNPRVTSRPLKGELEWTANAYRGRQSTSLPRHHMIQPGSLRTLSLPTEASAPPERCVAMRTYCTASALRGGRGPIRLHAHVCPPSYVLSDPVGGGTPLSRRRHIYAFPTFMTPYPGAIVRSSIKVVKRRLTPGQQHFFSTWAKSHRITKRST